MTITPRELNVPPNSVSNISAVLFSPQLKSNILGDMMPCSLIDVNQRFGGICCLHLQGRRVRRLTSKTQPTSRSE
jgi:hypothetical protein